MTDREIQIIQDHARKKLTQRLTREEALLSLQRAGILDKNGNYTKPYKILERITKR